jgi:hypothetical protein
MYQNQAQQFSLMAPVGSDEIGLALPVRTLCFIRKWSTLECLRADNMHMKLTMTLTMMQLKGSQKGM